MQNSQLLMKILIESFYTAYNLQKMEYDKNQLN